MGRAILGAVVGAVIGLFLGLFVGDKMLWVWLGTELIAKTTQNHHALLVANCTASIAIIGAIVGGTGAIIAATKRDRLPAKP